MKVAVPQFVQNLLTVADSLQAFARTSGFSADHGFMTTDFTQLPLVAWTEAGTDVITHLRGQIIGFHGSAAFNGHVTQLAVSSPDIAVPRLRRILPDPPPSAEQQRQIQAAVIQSLQHSALSDYPHILQTLVFGGMFGQATDAAFIANLPRLIFASDLAVGFRLLEQRHAFSGQSAFVRELLFVACDHYLANRSFEKAYDLGLACRAMDASSGAVSLDLADKLWYIAFRLGHQADAKAALASWMSIRPLHKRPLVYSAIVAAKDRDRAAAYDYLRLSRAHLGESTVGGNVLHAEYKLQDGAALEAEVAIRRAIEQCEGNRQPVPHDYHVALHNLVLQRGVETTLLAPLFQHHGHKLRWSTFRIDSVEDLTPSSVRYDKSVAVVMTAWNAEAYLQRAMDGILRQTHSNLHLIVMDDCSSDATADICQRAAAQDARVICLRTPRNIGTYAAKNIGIKHALQLGVDYVTLCDSDDYWLRTHLEVHLAEMAQDPELCCTTSQWVRIRDDGSVECGLRGAYVESCPHSTFFRADVFQRAGFFDAVRFGADREFFSRVQVHFGKTAMRSIGRILTLGRRHGTSLTTSGEGAISEFNESPTRISYWKRWNEWHRAALLAGRKPVTSGEVSDRPFAVPPEMQIG